MLSKVMMCAWSLLRDGFTARGGRYWLAWDCCGRAWAGGATLARAPRDQASAADRIKAWLRERRADSFSAYW